jgi:hypothetical protein
VRTDSPSYFSGCKRFLKCRHGDWNLVPSLPDLGSEEAPGACGVVRTNPVNRARVDRLRETRQTLA